jgi:tRNA modification GTPase
VQESPADTIVAPATAAGESALSVVRIAGASALAIAAEMFRGADLNVAESHRAHHGWIVDRDGARIDEVLVLTLRAPAGYTGEDSAEFFCHGSPQVVEDVIAAALAAGARMAEPGEFTRRAFLNGKLDLCQAEAVADLIAAQSRAGRRAAVAQLHGALSRRLQQARSALLGVLSEVEASIDFVEEGLEFFDREATARVATATAAEVEALLDTAGDGEMLRSGVRVSLAGAPNVGKSSLFNRLVQSPRALVTEYPGTTRDVLRETLRLNGIAFVVEDTAGLRHSEDPVERLGVERSRESHAEADIVIQVLDASRPLTQVEIESVRTLTAEDGVIVLNKVDLLTRDESSQLLQNPASAQAFIARGCNAEELPACVAASAATGDGVEALRGALLRQARVRRLTLQNDAVVAVNARHREALLRAQDALRQFDRDLESQEPPEILATELRRAVVALGEVSGENITEEILDRVFARFCIGK